MSDTFIPLWRRWLKILLSFQIGTSTKGRQSPHTLHSTRRIRVIILLSILFLKSFNRVYDKSYRFQKEWTLLWPSDRSVFHGSVFFLHKSVQWWQRFRTMLQQSYQSNRMFLNNGEHFKSKGKVSPAMQLNGPAPHSCATKFIVFPTIHTSTF